MLTVVRHIPTELLFYAGVDKSVLEVLDLDQEFTLPVVTRAEEAAKEQAGPNHLQRCCVVVEGVGGAAEEVGTTFARFGEVVEVRGFVQASRHTRYAREEALSAHTSIGLQKKSFSLRELQPTQPKGVTSVRRPLSSLIFCLFGL